MKGISSLGIRSSWCSDSTFYLTLFISQSFKGIGGNTLQFYEGKKLKQEKKKKKSRQACDNRQLKVFGDPPNGNMGCQVFK